MTTLLALWRDLLAGDRRLLLAVAALLGAAVLTDFVLRVHVPRDASLREFTRPPKLEVPAPVAAPVAAAAVESWLPATPVEAAKKEREFLLRGIFRSRSAAAVALGLRDPDTGATQALRAAQGEVVDGWTIERIEPRRVTLRRGEEDRELLLFRRPAE